MISKNDEQVLKALSESFNTNLLQKKSIMESLEYAISINNTIYPKLKSAQLNEILKLFAHEQKPKNNAQLRSLIIEVFQVVMQKHINPALGDAELKEALEDNIVKANLW
ncbi:hypothetical protein ICE89_11370 [Polynucleobacter sp. AP-Kaivos-20-H2]|nr:hypothetical protein [Polynucleobacter sp. AP-Kaivos-20-H2]